MWNMKERIICKFYFFVVFVIHFKYSTQPDDDWPGSPVATPFTSMYSPLRNWTMSFFVYNDRDFSSNFPFQLNALLDFLLDCFFFTVIDEGRFCRFMELAISWSRFGGFPISLLSSPAVHGLAFFFPLWSAFAEYEGDCYSFRWDLLLADSDLLFAKYLLLPLRSLYDIL